VKKKVAPPPALSFTPRDVGLGLTRAEDVVFPLRWGIMGTGEISRQFVCASRECAGATMAAVASRSADPSARHCLNYTVRADTSDSIRLRVRDIYPAKSVDRNASNTSELRVRRRPAITGIPEFPATRHVQYDKRYADHWWQAWNRQGRIRRTS